MGSVLNLMPSEEIHIQVQPRKSDLENLKGDWEKIGQDMYTAVSKTENGKQKQTSC